MMTVPQVIITVFCTVLGSVAIAYITFYLQAKRRERTLFRALHGEIKGNRRLAEEQERQEREIPKPDAEIAPERGPLYTEAYQNIRLAGELLTLPDSVQQKLGYTYELINTNNRKIPSIADEILDKDVHRRIDKIIQNLKHLEDELPKHISNLDTSNHALQHEPQEDLLRRYLMAQVPTFFFFGLLAILAHLLLPSKDNLEMSIWGSAQYILGWFLLPIGAIAILWALVLAVVAFDLKMPRKLKRAEEAIIQWVERKNDVPIYYVAAMVVFGTSFAAVLAQMLQAGIDVLFFYILYSAGLLLTLILLVYHVYSRWHRKQTKTTTTQNSQSQNQDA